MKKNKYKDLLPILAFAVALICKCDTMEAVSVMMFTNIVLLNDKVKALEEAVTSPKAE